MSKGMYWRQRAVNQAAESAAHVKSTSRNSFIRRMNMSENLHVEGEAIGALVDILHCVVNICILSNY